MEVCRRAGLRQWQTLFGNSASHTSHEWATSRDLDEHTAELHYTAGRSGDALHASDKDRSDRHMPEHAAVGDGVKTTGNAGTRASSADEEAQRLGRLEWIRVPSVLRVRREDAAGAQPSHCEESDAHVPAQGNVSYMEEAGRRANRSKHTGEGGVCGGHGCDLLLSSQPPHASAASSRAETRLPATVDRTAEDDDDGDGATFVQRIERDFAGCTPEQLQQALGKQRAFQSALLDLQCVFGDTACGSVPFFLACGTALGAWREGYFIPHDTDIDVGVFYEDLCAHGRHVMTSRNYACSTSALTSSGKGAAAGGAHAGLVSSQTCDVGQMSWAVVDLLARLSVDGVFVLFDLCGSMEQGGGLELRLLHESSGVRVDVNVYYPPINRAGSSQACEKSPCETNTNTDDDAALVQKFGHFVWHASYYEEAGRRRHGMYRYRHAPFRHALLRKRFCAEGVSSLVRNNFLVPPVSYLVEYFGADWQTPREYSYSEGLKGDTGTSLTNSLFYTS